MTRIESFIAKAFRGLWLLIATTAAAQTVNVTSYPLAAGAASITTGPDGALWFAGFPEDTIGRITTGGQATYFPIPDPDSMYVPLSITTGPDGALWFIESKSYLPSELAARIGRITTSGSVTTFAVPDRTASPSQIVVGSDGALWFNDKTNAEIWRVTTAGVFTTYSTAAAAWAITSGPDGALWFLEYSSTTSEDEESTFSGKVGRLIVSGALTEYPFPQTFTTSGQLTEHDVITTGPDGALWFSQYSGLNIGRVTTDGMITIIATNVEADSDLTRGPDGALWFSRLTNLIRLTTSGSTTSYPLGQPFYGVAGITLGPDNVFWLTGDGSTSESGLIGRVSIFSALAVTAPCPGPISIQGDPYSYSITASGGFLPLTWSLANGASLPAGVSLNTSTGDISGTPTSSGSFDLKAVVTDSASPTPDTSAFNCSTAIVILPRLVLTTASLTGAVVGTMYDGAPLQAQGGTAPYHWSLGPGSLPTGLMLNALTGLLSGTPAGPAAPSTFTVTVTDSGSPAQTATKSMSIAVAPAFAITATSLPNGSKGFLYSYTLLAKNGTPPYNWSLSSGDLPAGLTLSSATGAITGAAAAAGTSSFTVKAADSSSQAQTATQLFNLSIISGLTIATTALPSGTAGLSYAAGLSGLSGTTPYVWSINSGSLPGGLNLNPSTGTITGIPTAEGTFSFTVNLSDSSTPSAQRISQPLSLFINPPGTQPVTPTFTLTGLPPSEAPGTPVTKASAQLNEPSSAGFLGTLTLAFRPNPNEAGLPSGYLGDAGFMGSDGTKLWSASLLLPAATTSVPLPSLDPGTVAGALTLTLSVGGQMVAASTVTIEPQAPIIEANSVQFLNLTANEFDVELVATSTTRELGTAEFVFTPAPGAQISGTGKFTVDVSQLLTGWFAGAAGLNYGGAFTLIVPFTFSGPANSIQSVSVTLTNSIGTSAAAVATQ